MSEPALEVRPLATHAEFYDAVELQRRIWKFDEIDLLPVRLFVVASKIGGQALGAYDGERMIGFCLGIPGLRPGGLYYLHSHMLGVLPEYRNRGAGRMLKLSQREDCLERGIDLVEWTFDPLEIKNAHFNIERLGAIVRRYVLNQYGNSSSPLQGGLPTDRCTAEWWVAAPDVQAVLTGKPQPRDVRARIEVPANIADIRRDEPKRAREIQKSIGEQFQKYFRDGLAVTGFEKLPHTGVYLLGQDPVPQ